MTPHPLCKLKPALGVRKLRIAQEYADMRTSDEDCSCIVRVCRFDDCDAACTQVIANGEADEDIRLNKKHGNLQIIR